MNNLRMIQQKGQTSSSQAKTVVRRQDAKGVSDQMRKYRQEK